MKQRDAFMQRMKPMWERTDRIFDLLKEEAFLDKPISLRHPFIFYLGHLPAFFWNQLHYFCPEIPHFDEELAILFERGIDPDVDTRAVHDNSAGQYRSEWPSLKQVKHFRDEVRKRTPALLDAVLAKDPTSHVELEQARIVELLYEHEAMHQETLLYMFNCLDLSRFSDNALASPLFRKEKPPVSQPVDTSFASVLCSDNVMIGADMKDPLTPWGWDNEFPTQVMHVDAFEIRKTPITNGEFLPFVLSGAYRNKELWDEADYRWVSEQKMEHPIHWRKGENNSWRLRTIGAEIEMEGTVLDWPVQVSLAEASAWCKWKGDDLRLPTEVEWYHAAYSHPDTSTYSRFAWGDCPPTPEHGNFGFARLTPTPVYQFPKGKSAYGLYDMLGNGWEWIQTPFAGFDGFKPFLTTYPGYSADFYDGKHFVLRGGSFATSLEQLRPSFRNWYQRRYPYPFSKFRPVRKSLSQNPSKTILKLEEKSQEQELQEFADHVRRGLTLEQPVLSSLYFYDVTGSEIFEEITHLDEYYLTRVEDSILQACKNEIGKIIRNGNKSLNLIEFGAGDGHKIQPLLDHFASLSLDVTYFPVDISQAALQHLLNVVRAPRISALLADNLVGLSYVMSQNTLPTLALFLGSSIGNYDFQDAIAFLKRVQSLLREGDYFLIGFDLKKNLEDLHDAYFDKKGVTSRFNYNLLARINRELGANFDLASGVWQHEAKWNSDVDAMESWLTPTQDQIVTLGSIAGNQAIAFRKGQGIRVERSHKYTLSQIDQIASDAGFTVVKKFVRDGFCDALLRKAATT